MHFWSWNDQVFESSGFFPDYIVVQKKFEQQFFHEVAMSESRDTIVQSNVGYFLALYTLQTSQECSAVLRCDISLDHA